MRNVLFNTASRSTQTVVTLNAEGNYMEAYIGNGRVSHAYINLNDSGIFVRVGSFGYKYDDMLRVFKALGEDYPITQGRHTELYEAMDDAKGMATAFAGLVTEELGQMLVDGLNQWDVYANNISVTHAELEKSDEISTACIMILRKIMQTNTLELPTPVWFKHSFDPIAFAALRRLAREFVKPEVSE